MVLFIVSLILGGMLVPLATQLEIRQRNEVDDKLEEIKDALIGFAIINGRLPCPTINTDPTSASYGEEDTPCDDQSEAEGYLPWETLGLGEFDPWGIVRSSVSDPMYGYYRYRVDRAFACTTVDCNDSTITLSQAFSDSLVVQDAAGNALTSATEPPVAIIYSTGADQVPNDENADDNIADGTYQGGPATETFDDIVTWLSRPLLYSRLVTAGTLP